MHCVSHSPILGEHGISQLLHRSQLIKGRLVKVVHHYCVKHTLVHRNVIAQLKVGHKSGIRVVFINSGDIKGQVARRNDKGAVQVNLVLFKLANPRNLLRLLDQLKGNVFAHISVNEPLSSSILHPVLLVGFEFFKRVVFQLLRNYFR